MIVIIKALRDFAEGLSCGISLYFTERNDYTAKSTMPGRISRR